MQDKVFMGNLSSKRDWGHAKDYIKAMYLILQQDQPDDYVIATGITTTIRDFICKAAAEVGLILTFEGEGVDEKGYFTAVDKSIFVERVGEFYLDNIQKRIENKEVIVGVDPKYFRPTEVDLLIGDPTKAQTKLGWKPEYDLDGLIKDMMRSDIKLMQKDAYLRKGGYQTLKYFE